MSDLQDRRDQALLAKVAKGDEDAFAEFYRRYATAAFSVAARVLANQTLAEEVVQEVFLSVWRRADSHDAARGSVRSWLLAQMHHRAVDAVRREEAERRRATTVGAAIDTRDEIDDVVEEDWMKARREAVRGAMQTLTADHREVVELAYFGGMTQVQVAKSIGIPLGTVKSRTLAAMRSLRGALGEAGA